MAVEKQISKQKHLTLVCRSCARVVGFVADATVAVHATDVANVASAGAVLPILQWHAVVLNSLSCY